MSLLSAFRAIALLSLVAIAVLVPATESFAQGGRIRMEAPISGVKAKAKYEEKGSNRKFNFELELGTPGQVGMVSVTTPSGSTFNIGSFTVDSLRRGKLERNTKDGQTVPTLPSGSVVKLKIGGKTYMGTLR